MWFEEPEATEEEQREDVITPEVIKEAKEYNAQFKQELEDLRAVMIRHPENLHYVLAYKQKEQELYKRSGSLSQSWVLANLLDPELLDELKNPQNLYGRKAKAELDKERRQAALKALAGKLELFIFRQDNCPHCHFLEKHLANMAREHNFEVTAITKDGSKSPYFPAHHQPELIRALDLKVVPMVVAVTKDSAERFEIARGAVSIPEMEEKLLLVGKGLKLKQALPKKGVKLPALPVVDKEKMTRRGVR